jgi:hypothetical protein
VSLRSLLRLTDLRLFDVFLGNLVSPKVELKVLTSRKGKNKNKKTRLYRIYRIKSLTELPSQAEIGDLAILLSAEQVEGFFYDGNWVPDTGYRVNQGRKLTHFPDPEWERWILHGDSDSLRWEHDDTVRYEGKKAVEMEKRGRTEVKRSERGSSRSSRPDIPYSFTPSPTPPLKENATELLSRIVKHLGSIFANSPKTFIKCAGPLKQLLKNGNSATIPIIEPGNAKTDGLLPGQHITMTSLYKDLMQNDDASTLEIQDLFRVSGNKSVAQLMTAMSSDSKGLLGSSTPVVLGALNIPAHPDGSKLIEILLPFHLRNSGVCTPVPNGFTDNTAVLTSPGFISEPHWDFYAIPQKVIHAGGIKLWLIWPPTSENLKKGSENLLSPESSIDFTISKALEELNDLEIRLCTKQDDWFILAPCAIHAVITVTPSAHKNKLFVDYGSFNTFDEAYSLITETLVLESRKDCTRRAAIIEEILESRKAFHHWESLLKQNSHHPSATKTRERLNEIKKETQARLKSLGYTPSKKRSSDPLVKESNVKRLRKN